MDIVTKLEDAYAFLGDPLHREAANEIERLRKYVKLLGEEVYLLNKDQPSGDKPDEDS